MEEIKDERFSHIASDPRFRTTPKSIRKVKIDKRFQSLFTDKRFQVKYSVDKRGRPINQSSQENYRKYYDVLSDEESSDNGNEVEDSTKDVNDSEDSSESSTESKTIKNNQNIKQNKNKSPKTNKWVVTPSSDSDSRSKIESSKKYDYVDETDKEKKKTSKKIGSIQLEDLEMDKLEKARMTDEIKMKLRDPHIDYARGVGTLMSDSSSEEESSESESESELEHGWGELDRDAEVTEEATSRLAVLHMDWDRIRAVDLMVLFNSFLPQDGVIKSVTIYPSQFGLERMKEEEERGPIELVNLKVEEEAELDEESKEGKKYHTERLRQYQLNRLKYYYAVIEFDSVETADKVYSECDGLEYESSATKLDLRFVPEDETFEQEPREVCTSMPDPAKYEPRIFTNTALQQGKVELTWDETDPSRQEFTKKIQRNADKIDDVDLQAYLASSSSEDEENSENKENGESVSDSESNDDKDNVKEEDKIAKYKSLLASIEEEEEKKKSRDVDLEITWGVGLKEKAEKSVKEKLNAPQTPFEEMLDKRRKKKKQKREEKLKQKEKENSESNLYSDDDLPSDVDINDPYFKEELQGSKKEKKNKKKLVDEEESEEIKQKEAELELLLMEENDVEKQKSHFSLKKIQEQENEGKKKKRRKQLKKKPQEILEDKDEFKVDVADDRFSALFTSHHFNVDPAEPQFRKTKAMEAIISEKLKRRREQVEQEVLPGKIKKTDMELSQLVNKIKSKTKNKLRN